MWWADGLLKRRRLALLQTRGRLEWAVVRGRAGAMQVESQGAVETPLEFDAAAQLRAFELPEGAQGLPLELSVSDDALDAVSLPWSETLLTRGLRRAYLRAVFAAAGAPTHADDRFRFDAGAAGRSRMCLRYPAPLLEALHALCERGRLRLRWVRSQGLGVWALASKLPGSKSVGVIGTRQASLWLGERRVHGLRLSVGLADADASAQECERLRQRETLRAAAAPTSAVMAGEASAPPVGVIAATDLVPPVPAGLSEALWLALQGPARAQAMDLRARIQRQAGAWLVVGSLFVALAGFAGTRFVREAALAQPAPTPAPQSTEATLRPLSSSDAARWTELAPVVQSLNTPFADVLQALRPPKDVAVQVQQVEVIRAAPDTQLERRYRIRAEAPQAVEMLKYMAVLQKRRAWSSVRLLSQGSDGKSSALQFQMELTWRP